MPSQTRTVKEKKLGFEELQRDVVLKGRCTGCGACFVACPVKGVLDYTSHTPVVVGECIHCGICLRVCPRYEDAREELETMVFGRTRTPEEVFGIYENVYVARSTREDILEHCQDGGVATTLLVSAFLSRTIDSAAISGITPSSPWLPRPLLSTDLQEIIENAGTRYTYSPNLLAYKEGVTQGREKIAFVGTPCQIRALRRIQQASLRKYTRALAFTIGLFCSECFSYEGLLRGKIQGELGIDLTDITKMNIKGGVLITTKRGQAVKIPLKDAKKFGEPKCRYCDDFSAELADIAVGGVGLEGWTFTIIRTEKGRTLFNHALTKGFLEAKGVEEFESAFTLMQKLSRIKRKRAMNNRKNGFSPLTRNLGETASAVRNHENRR
jgi:coenzyme F420 hydrogenase subunit beta